MKEVGVGKEHPRCRMENALYFQRVPNRLILGMFCRAKWGIVDFVAELLRWPQAFRMLFEMHLENIQNFHCQSMELLAF
jgi:hypothetical protein